MNLRIVPSEDDTIFRAYALETANPKNTQSPRYHDCRFGDATLAFSAIGCVVSMRLFERACNVRHTKHEAFISMAGIVGGMTIWTTHFLVMLSFIPNVEHGFEPNFALFSLAFIITTSMAGFLVTANRERS